MTQHNKPLVNKGYKLAITPPEEGAGAAYDAMKPLLLDGLGIDYVELPMDMASRVLSDCQAVTDASEYVKNDPHCIYVKGPGITPRDDQVISTILHLENTGALTFTKADLNDRLAQIRKQYNSQTHAAEFAAEVKKIIQKIGSPNAKWRDVLQANLARGCADDLVERSLAQTPQWNAQTPLSTYVFGRHADNQQSGTINYEDGQYYRVEFIPDGKEIPVIIREKVAVSGGTPLRLFSNTKQEFDSWADAALTDAKAKGAKIAHGMKQTVLKEYDESMRQWMNEAISRHNMQDSIAPDAQQRDKEGKPTGQLNNLLVDDLFSRLSTKQLSEPLAILSPNHSYGAYVRDVWRKVAENGGLKIPQHSQIVRASATGDHYKAVEHIAENDGTLRVKDAQGNIVMQKHMQAGDIAMITHLDRKRTREMIAQSLQNAKDNGHTTLLFGFDKDDDYYSIAHEELATLRLKHPNLKIEIADAAEATARYLTSGAKDTVLVLNNIYGDFATDIEISGKGTSYSIGTMFDGRGVVELGSGGTAPDLVTKWRETGLLEFNPMAFVEGIALALGFAARKMQQTGANNSDTLAISKAVERAVYATTDKGIVLPFIRGKFTKADEAEYTSVGTQSFLQSVKVEAMKILEPTHPHLAATLKQEAAKLEDMIALDKALIEANQKFGERWRAANKTWNEKREAAGEIDPFKPDYSIPLEAGMDPREVTAEELLARQEKRAVTGTRAQKTG